MSVAIRTMTADEMPKVLSLNTEAFGQSDEAGIVETLHEDDASLLSLVAEVDGDLTGHIQFFPIDVVGPVPGVVAGLGPMSVRPDRQRAGIGRALIEAGLAQMTQMQVSKVFVLGHPDYYPKFGFSVDETAGFAAPWGGPAFMAITLNPGGPEFGQLNYPDAFLE